MNVSVCVCFSVSAHCVFRGRVVGCVELRVESVLVRQRVVRRFSIAGHCRLSQRIWPVAKFDLALGIVLGSGGQMHTEQTSRAKKRTRMRSRSRSDDALTALTLIPVRIHVSSDLLRTTRV